VNSNSLDPDSAYAIDNTTDRYYVESNYGFKYLAGQNLAVSFGISRRNDKVLLGTDLNNFNFSLMLNSDFGSTPLRTTVGFNISGNQTTLRDTTAMMLEEEIQTFNYTFITIGATYGLLSNKLLVGANYMPTFGAFTRNSFGFTASYKVASRQSVNLNVNYLAVTGSDDFIGSLVYAVDF